MFIYFQKPSQFGSEVGYTDLGGEVSGSRLGHNNDFKNGTYCSSACAGHNEIKKGEYLSHKKAQRIPYTMDIQTKVVLFKGHRAILQAKDSQGKFSDWIRIRRGRVSLILELINQLIKFEEEKIFGLQNKFCNYEKRNTSENFHCEFFP